MPVRVSLTGRRCSRPAPLADRLPQLRRAPRLELADGLTAVVGDNGQGKTNLLEALGYLATLESFRGAPTEALVRPAPTRPSCGPRSSTRRPRAAGRGRARAAPAATGCRSTGSACARPVTCSASLRVTVFSPDDLELVKGGPAERRRFLDDTLVALHPKHDALRADLDRVLRQRNALLQAGRAGA